MKSADEVLRLFRDERNFIGNTTNLAAVLKDASQLPPRPGPDRKPKTLLVITDGAPDSQPDVEAAIVDAAQQMAAEGELSITIVQVGSDATATAWLEGLDACIKSRGANFHIVDVLSHQTLQNTNLAALLKESMDT